MSKEAKRATKDAEKTKAIAENVATSQHFTLTTIGESLGKRIENFRDIQTFVATFNLKECQEKMSRQSLDVFEDQPMTHFVATNLLMSRQYLRRLAVQSKKSYRNISNGCRNNYEKSLSRINQKLLQHKVKKNVK